MQEKSYFEALANATFGDSKIWQSVVKHQSLIEAKKFIITSRQFTDWDIATEVNSHLGRVTSHITAMESLLSTLEPLAFYLDGERAISEVDIVAVSRRISPGLQASTTADKLGVEDSKTKGKRGTRDQRRVVLELDASRKHVVHILNSLVAIQKAACKVQSTNQEAIRNFKE